MGMLEANTIVLTKEPFLLIEEAAHSYLTVDVRMEQESHKNTWRNDLYVKHLANKMKK